MGTALLGLLARSRMRGGEELRQLSATKSVTQYAECARGISETTRHHGRRLVFEVEGPQGLILTLARRRNATFCYAIWCSDRHLRTVSCAEPLVKRELHRNTINVEEICFVQGLSAPHRIPVTLGAIYQKRKLTTQKWSISALFWIT